MSRWIIVSNRLPFKLKADGTFAQASGGLVTAIGGIHTEGKVERIWMGGAPEGLTELNWSKKKTQQAKDDWQHLPVFVDETLYDEFYNGFCNDVLWPILHYQNDFVHFSDHAWNAYIKVNQLFAQKLAAFAKPDDLIWIHDYHFFLLPQFLRRLRPDLKIGFFLHVPFPSSEVFRQLPVRETILESLLAADLIGFHDYAYLHHFSSSLTRILGIDSSLLSVKSGAHTTRLGVFPVSIDTAEFKSKAAKPEVAILEKRYREKGQFMFLGVDRLDYIKGLDLKLCAFKSLLERYPEVRGKVSLLQVAIPTRTGSPEFIKLYQETSRLIGEINGTYSRPDWTPIHYIYNSVNSDELMAIYKASDALLVTSKRDGMNLVALEYIVTQSLERPGVVLLSEFTGALSTLSHTVRINPWNADDTADKMKLAMEMPKQEKIHRLQAMQKYLDGYTATDWARLFLQDLESTTPAAQGAELFLPTRDSVDELAKKIATKMGNNGKVTLFLDYDGTLVPIEESPELATLPSSTRQWINDFGKRPWLNLVMVSGRDARFLSKQFSGTEIPLAAEHGGSFLDISKNKWIRRVHQPRTTWYQSAQKIMSHYSMRVPRSRVEKKRFSLAWHYRQSPNEYAGYMARKLADELETGLANLPVTIVRGKKVIEVRASEADKGVFTNWYLEHYAPSTFPLAFGDDRTDEDMFRAVRGRSGMSFKIGVTDTSADYMLEVQAQVLPFLSALIGRLDRLLGTNATAGAGRAPSQRMELVPTVAHQPSL